MTMTIKVTNRTPREPSVVFPAIAIRVDHTTVILSTVVLDSAKITKERVMDILAATFHIDRWSIRGCPHIGGGGKELVGYFECAKTHVDRLVEWFDT